MLSSLFSNFQWYNKNFYVYIFMSVESPKKVLLTDASLSAKKSWISSKE